MKRKDVAVIIATAVLAGIVSLIVGHFLFATPKDRQQSVEVVEAINTQFNAPDTKYFNQNSINPTQLIRIGENSNNTPFNGAAQQ